MLNKLLFLLLLIQSHSIFASFLVDTNWLKKNLGKPGMVLIDMSDNTQYQRFHIPGAVHLPYQALNQRTKKGVSFSIGKDNVARLLGFIGVTPESHIVIYDDMGGLHAGRLFWELERIGHKKVSLLDGGLVTWILQGNKVTNKPVEYSKTNYVINTKGTNNLAEKNDMLNKKKGIIIDARSKEEYTGHPRYPRSGHIPGAKWLEWQSFVDFENGFKLKNKNDLEKMLSNIGLKDKNTPVTLYCRSGHRAAQSYLTLRQLGYNKVRLYDGSMADYVLDKNAPLNRGSQP